MGVNDTSRIIIGDSIVMLQIVASLTYDSRGMNYNPVFIVQATDACSLIHLHMTTHILDKNTLASEIGKGQGERERERKRKKERESTCV
jgi:hypothetical protein